VGIRIFQVQRNIALPGFKVSAYRVQEKRLGATDASYPQRRAQRCVERVDALHIPQHAEECGDLILG